MKVKVEIPEGKYCNGCPLLDTLRGQEHCDYIGEEVEYRRGFLKHPNCPSLKEKEMPKLKRISNERIKETVAQRYKELTEEEIAPVLVDMHLAYLILDAQLQADQKVMDATIKEIFEEIKAGFELDNFEDYIQVLEQKYQGGK